MEAVDLVTQVRIRRSVPTATYFQFYSEIRRLVAEGKLRPGDRLPTITSLSSALALSRTTVVRALNELARQGVVIPRWGEGNFIAERVIPLTEVLIHGTTPPPAQVGFYEEIIEAFGAAATPGERRVSLSYTHGQTPLAGEVLKIAAARGTDSLAVYRPQGEFACEMRSVAANLPTVALFQPLDDSPADAVLSDPTVPLKEALKRRWNDGQRRFFFIVNPTLTLPSPHSPYALMQRCYHNFMSETGSEGKEYTLESVRGTASFTSEMDTLIRSIPRGAMVVTHTYGLIEPSRKKFDIVAYTESHLTVERHIAGCSILYLDLAEMAVQALKTLMERKSNGRLEPRIVRLAPKMVACGQMPPRKAHQPDEAVRRNDE